MGVTMDLRSLTTIRPIRSFVNPILRLVAGSERHVAILLSTLMRRLRFKKDCTIQIVNVKACLIRKGTPSFMGKKLVKNFRGVLQCLLATTQHQTVTPLIKPGPTCLRGWSFFVVRVRVHL